MSHPITTLGYVVSRTGLGLPAVVLLARVCVIIALGSMTQSLVTPSEEGYSFLQMLRSGIHLLDDATLTVREKVQIN